MPVVLFARQAEFEKLVSMLPEADPCFAVFDFTDTTADGRIVKKLLLVKWYARCFVACCSVT